jgi:hypothetical protein
MRDLDKFYAERLESLFTAHEFWSIKTLLPGLPTKDYSSSSMPLLARSQQKMMNKYIHNKSMFLKGK